MKKQISRYVFISSVALFIAIAIISCGNKNLELLAKTWKLEKMEIPGQDSMIAKMDTTQRVMYESMMKQMIEKSSFAFTKEGKFVVDMGFAKSEGTFKLSDDGKKLTTTETKEGKPGKEESITVQELSATKFVMAQKDPMGKEVILTLVPASAK